jgi:hypothetical protein
MYEREFAIVIFRVHGEDNAPLAQVRLASNCLGLTSDSLNGRKQYRHQQRNDGNDH